LQGHHALQTGPRDAAAARRLDAGQGRQLAPPLTFGGPDAAIDHTLSEVRTMNDSQAFFDLLATGGLRPLRLRGQDLLPLVQGGMGVGVSAHRLAGSVAALGGVGTISSVDLRRHHPDLLARSAGMAPGPQMKAVIDAANLEALAREIGAARALAGGRGLLAVNVMRAVGEYAPSVRAALEAGIDAVVVGAGLPLDLPELAREHPQALLVPILSDSRGVSLLVKKWERKGRLPDAIVIEHPRWAGGHLGAAKIADLDDPRFDFERVIPEVLAFLRGAGVEREVPLIAAGGVRCFDDIRRLQALGAAAVQLGTPFVATEECDAHPEFKRLLAEARDDDMVEFTSVAGLPARAVLTPWLRSYLKAEPKLQAVAHAKPRCNQSFDCLAQCGLRDGTAQWGQFCIDKQLSAALRGDVSKGLFFRGKGALPFGSRIVPVRQLVERLLTPGDGVGSTAPPAALAAFTAGVAA
jgi:nitronate monooxygenase